MPAAFILPLFAIADRLPKWLGWFMTPDATLCGDQGWAKEHWQWRRRLPPRLCQYVGHAGWLLRNRVYGFKWGPLGCNAAPFEAMGNTAIKNRDSGVAGSFRLYQVGSPFWYRKTITPLCFGYCLQLAFGWQLDAPIRGRCLFMFSPRLTVFSPKKSPSGNQPI